MSILEKQNANLRTDLQNTEITLNVEFLTEPSGEHFTKRGHNFSHNKGLILERVRNPDHLFIRKFDAFHCGLNQKV